MGGGEGALDMGSAPPPRDKLWIRPWMVSTKPRQGSCAGLEFKASLEKSLNFRKLKKALNCFGKRVEGLEKFGICLSFVKVSTRLGDCVNCHSC